MRRWVFDASPLIALGKAGLLWIPEGLGVEGVIPEAVATEITAGDDADPAKLWLLSRPPFSIEPVQVSPVVAA